MDSNYLIKSKMKNSKVNFPGVLVLLRHPEALRS